MFSKLRKRSGNSSDRYLVIYSKLSGRKKLRDRADIIKKFFKKHNVFCHFSFLDENTPTIERINIALLKEKFDTNKILVAGGDGTLRRVVEYNYFHDINDPIAFFPIGTGNIYARILGISYMFEKILENLLTPRIKKMPIGLVNKKHIFIIASCFGKMAELILKTDSNLKKKIGFFAYVVTSLRYTVLFHRKSINITTSEEGSHRVNLHSIFVFFNECIQKILPEPFHAKNKLSIIIFRNKTPIGLLHGLYDLFVKKQSSSNIEIINTNKITIQGHFKEQINLDGDQIDDNDQEFVIELVDKKISFLY